MQQVKHAKLLEELFTKAGAYPAIVTGTMAGTKRLAMIEEVRVRELDVLVGTVFNEAIDLPWLDTVIIGGAMKSRVLTLQRLRNLTPTDAEGKVLHEPMVDSKRVRVYDFADFSCDVLAEHSRARLGEYRRHRAFEITWRD